MGATIDEERAIADLRFGSGSPTTWWLGLSTSTPQNDGSGFAEPIGNGYTRVQITNNTSNFPASTVVDGITRKRNGQPFTFTNPTGPWGNITHWGFFTSSTGGLPRWVQPLDSPISPRAGHSPVEFAAQQIELTFQ